MTTQLTCQEVMSRPQCREDVAKGLGNLAELKRETSELGKVPLLSYQSDKN